jgi:CheY-like chemotaxis protein
MAKILLIEDDDQIRASYGLVLTKKGHMVKEASDGQEALQILEHNDFDVILLDMLMPNMSGIEFLRQARIHSRHSKTKVLAISNTESPKIIGEAKELGVNRYLLKVDFNPYELADLIAKSLND